MTFIRAPIDEARLLSQGEVFPEISKINIIHPGYDSRDDPESDILISFQAFDDGGIHHDTAQMVCAILAANKWDGYFSRDRHGRQKVHPVDGILREGRYYFCLPSSTDPSTDQYPVITRFKDWRFPHGHLPPLWARLKEQLRADQPEGQLGIKNCSLSNCADAVEAAHLVPAKQPMWWGNNRMAQYARTQLFSTDPLDAPANLLQLRVDIHRMFDERHFTFVPKTVPPSPRDAIAQDKVDGSSRSNPEPHQDEDGTDSTNSHLPIRTNTEHNSQAAEAMSIPYVVGHVFNSTPSGQLPKKWHNRRVHSLPSTLSVECLFARFAYTIFSPSVFRDFLDAGKTRRILVWNREDRRHDVEEADPERCQGILSAARSRSESPRKRTRGEQQGDGECAELDRAPNAESDVDSAYHDDLRRSAKYGRGSSVSDEPERGRTRKRRSEVDYGSGLKISSSPDRKRTRLDLSI